jgi:hypothetical protein
VIALLNAQRHEVVLPRIAVAEALLRRRGFTPGLTSLLFARRLARYDLVHAFAPLDAVAALRAGATTVFTCTERLDRATVADRRLRLWALTQATERSAAVLAADDAIRASLQDWFAIDAPVLAPAELDALYGRL